MKKIILTIFIILTFAPAAHADPTFIFDVKPASFLDSLDIDGFRVQNSGSGYSETIDGTSSWLPSVNLGLGIGTRPCNFDFTIGVGLLANTAFSGSFIQADVSALFKLGPLNLGPHLGLISFGEMEWDASDDFISSADTGLIFESTKGTRAGLDLSVGKKIYFTASLDYINVDEAAITEINSGWTTNRSTIDLSGWAIAMGISGRF